MKLNNCEIRPGVVVTADDPKKMGRIKAVVPGWFNNASMHEEDMFWIAPFTSGSGYQRVSKCIEGQKVWVLHDSTNEYEYYYSQIPSNPYQIYLSFFQQLRYVFRHPEQIV